MQEVGTTEEFLDAVPTGIAVVDPGSGVVRDANDAFCERFARDGEAVVGRSLSDLGRAVSDGEIDDRLDANCEGETVTVGLPHPEDVDTHRVKLALSTYETEDGPLVTVAVREVSDGPDAGDDATGEPEPDGDQRQGSDGDRRQATDGDQRQADDHTRPLTEEELRAVYHSVNDAIYVHDAEGEVIDVNRTAAETYGYSRAAFREVEGLETSTGDPPYTSENASERLARAAEGESQTFEWKGKDSDGNVFWEEVSLTRTVVDGDVRVLAIVRDVDERKRYEQELEYRKALLEAQTEATIDGHLVVDGEGNILSYNSQLRDLWDVPAEILENRDSEALLEYILGEVADPEAFMATIEEIYDDRQIETRDQIRHEDGRWFDRYSAPVVSDGELYGRVWVFRDVTDSKERERALAERNERLRALFANSTAAIVEYAYEDGEPVVEDVNDRFEEVFGYDAETVVGHSLDEFVVPPEYREEASDLNAKVERGEYLSAEIERQTVDGVRSFMLRNAPIDTENETRGYASYTDITERKEREREIEEQREKYTTLVEQSHEGVAIVQDREFKFVNRAMEELTGRPEEELLGMPFYEVMAPEYRDLVRERYEKRLAGENPPGRYELDVVTSDGERRTADVGVSRINYRGAPATLATFNDVTEREEQRERFQAFIENSTDVITILAPDGSCEYQSPSSERVLGYDQDELIGEYLLEYVHPDDRERVAERFYEATENPDATPVLEYRFEHADGSYRWLESVGNNQLDNPAIEGLVINSRDVTERKEFERRIAEKNEKLELLNRIVRHDIRNDMAVARAETEVLADALDDTNRRHLDAIVESVDHVVELTDIVRDLMRTMLEDETAIEPIALGPVLDDELDVVRTMENVTVEASTPPPDLAVRADEMLGTVFRNLLTNAVRHNDTDEPTVSVAVESDDESVVVRIADDGPGIPDERKDEVFGRGEKGLESSGSGVGLYLVDTLIEGYGGDVWVEDADPRGAVFVVRLPRAHGPGA